MTAPNPALAYEQSYVPAYFRPLGNALVDRVRPTPSDRVLDVACGTAILARLIHERVGIPGRLAGVDINPLMVAVGQALAPFSACRQGDAGNLDFGDGEFDLVLCQHGLMFFPDRARALAEMRRVVSTGGRLGISTWRPISEHPLAEAFIKAGKRLVDAPIDLPWSLGDSQHLRTIIEAAGFGQVQVDTVEVTARFPDARAFTRMSVMAFGAVLPQFASMTESERNRFIATIEGETAADLDPHRDGDGVSFPVRANIATARAH
jgi:ubiquinone/menaquinone biosynthesis C-methylase UbiE